MAIIEVYQIFESINDKVTKQKEKTFLKEKALEENDKSCVVLGLK